MKRIVWTEKRIIEEAKKFKNRTEFWTVHRAGYIMAVRLGILDEIFPIHKGKRIILKRPQKWTLSHLKEVSKKYDYIVGLQGRYYYPCIFAALMVCGMLMKKRTEETGGEGVLAVYYVTHIVFLFNILMIV